MASVRFICGTQTVHRELERRLSAFLGTEDTILYSSCFDANGGLFETITGEEDAIISDALNHASIIDGIRLSKAKRLRYDNADLGQLEARLAEASGARTRLVVTDGVFSMDGTIAPLAGICDLAERHHATVVVDDSHATGFMGDGGRGTHEHCGVMGRVDVLTGTLGKALGGASGGYVSGRAPIIALAAPALAALPVFEHDRTGRRRDDARGPRPARVLARAAPAARGERRLVPRAARGRRIPHRPGRAPDHPRHDRRRRARRAMADRLLELGVYAIGFSYPVVPMGKARIRTQMCAAHTRAMLETAAAAFAQAGRELGVIGK